MPKAPTARRYAQAAFEIALEEDALGDWADDLAKVGRAVEEEEFATFLGAARVPMPEKLKVMDEVLSDVRPLARKLLSLLVTRGAHRQLPAIIRQYQRLYDVYRGIERGEVTTAVEVSEDLREDISRLLRTLIGKEVPVTSRVDGGILGGFVARVGDRLIDGSTGTRLANLKRSISSPVS